MAEVDDDGQLAFGGDGEHGTEAGIVDVERPTEQCSLSTRSPSRSTASTTSAAGASSAGCSVAPPTTSTGPPANIATVSADASLSPAAMPGLWAYENDHTRSTPSAARDSSTAAWSIG